MRNFITQFFNNHKGFWTKERRTDFSISLALVVLALGVQHVADTYVASIRGTPVDDLILSHIPTLDVDALIIWVSLLMPVIIIVLFLRKPKYLNFALRSSALFIIIRSALISLTHLGAHPHQLVLDPHSFGFGVYNILYNTSNDFFFSGHTGLPFLAALVFWDEKFWRYFFFFASFIMGFGVLGAHIHYSIDVFAAPFMTYSIYIIAQRLFPHDYAISQGK